MENTNSRMSFSACQPSNQDLSLDDPSQCDGYKQITQRQILVHVLGEYDIKQKQFQDMIMVRIFRKPDNTLKLQLTSQINIFFLYSTQLSLKDFKQFTEQQSLPGLTPQQFPFWLEKLLKEPLNSFKFEILPNRGELVIRQRLQFKEVRLAKIGFEYPTQDRIKESIMFRYGLMRRKKAQLAEVLLKTNGLMKVKNPAFLLNFQRVNKKAQVFK